MEGLRIAGVASWMSDEEQETRLQASKARQGEVSGRMRKVLTAGVILAAAAMLGAWWYYFG